jgi:hypothetical protein
MAWAEGLSTSESKMAKISPCILASLISNQGNGHGTPGLRMAANSCPNPWMSFDEF